MDQLGPRIACNGDPWTDTAPQGKAPGQTGIEASGPSASVTGQHPWTTSTGDGSRWSTALDQGVPLVQRAWSKRLDQHGLVHAQRGPRAWTNPGAGPGFLVQLALGPPRAVRPRGPAARGPDQSGHAVGPDRVRLLPTRRTTARVALGPAPRGPARCRAGVGQLGGLFPSSTSGTACAGRSSTTASTSGP
jgi:hypothetical protein